MEKLKTIVVMPGYNAEETLSRTLNDIPLNYVDEIIFVDDASRDKTVFHLKNFCDQSSFLTMSEEESKHNKDKKLVIIHEHLNNQGYGANQKSCYDLALRRGADIVVMIHPDYQYDPKITKYFVQYLQDNYFDVMLGSRIRSKKEALDGGMPKYKYFANRFLSLIENISSGYNLSEWHTGMRAYKKEVLEKINYSSFSNDFIFDTQMLFAIVKNRYSIGDIPVPVRYFKEASSINLKRSFRYGFLTLIEAFKFFIFRLKRNKISRYIFSGAIAFLANIITLFILVSLLKVWYLKAAIISFLIGIIFSYLMQKFFTFKDKRLKIAFPQFLLFTLFHIFMLGFNTFLMYLMVGRMNFHYLWAQIISSIFIAFINYFVFNRFFFKLSTVFKEN
jgi:putative flippase GtrA